MALRTNTKKARTNIVNYILEDMDYITERAEYDGKELTTTQNTLAYIYNIFLDEVGGWTVRNLRKTYFEAFKDWAQGLALGGTFCYYYNIDIYETLAKILEETEAEKEACKKKINEDQACAMLTALIYRELRQAYEKETA
jgi:hypothetical protein